MLVIVALLGLWELLTVSGVLDIRSLASPLGIVEGIRDLLASGALGDQLVHTVTAILVAWGLAAVGGVAYGVVLGTSRTVWTYSAASVEVLRTLPVIAFVPVALIFFGFSIRAEIAIATFGAFWPVVISTAGGVAGTHPRLDDVARSLGLSRMQTFWKISVPAAAPEALVGARIGMAVAIISVVVIEMIGVPEGLGYGLIRSQLALQIEQMWAYVMVIGLLGVALNAGLVFFARLVLPGAAARLGGERS